ncbi:pentatricopeptide repeat-containing protein At1g09190-like [Gastrolobium bilobum]|uniref:pentatricopeptide repeat-containing protein At1g09190-like n=1 Tax=Gastrolobium bilobum TaxID=150636 RepID=UPI002AB30D77|nr:pentatricopeptide repeat-containing protein At1g09190-like [Gastrolobium bilobum]
MTKRQRFVQNGLRDFQSRARRRYVIVWNLMIRGFCKLGNLEKGLKLFRQMKERSVVSWNLMISCLAHSKKDEKALDLFREMLEQGFEPDEASLVTVLPVCARLGALDVGEWIHSYANAEGYNGKGEVGVDLFGDRGRELFASMTIKFQLCPKLEHYGCVVDLLGRCGHVREARDLIRSMPMKPTAALWGALLSACRTYGDLIRSRSQYSEEQY